MIHVTPVSCQPDEGNPIAAKPQTVVQAGNPTLIEILGPRPSDLNPSIEAKPVKPIGSLVANLAAGHTALLELLSLEACTLNLRTSNAQSSLLMLHLALWPVASKAPGRLRKWWGNEGRTSSLGLECGGGSLRPWEVDFVGIISAEF